jgi:FMN phosphatase YigB (HAD superfamily)
MTSSIAAFSTIQFILFDLDGTVYQDLNVHRYYIPFLVENSKYADWAPALCQFCDKVLAGEALQMNAFYLPSSRDFNSPEELFRHIAAMQVPEAELEAINLGDLWALLSLIGSSLGLTENGRGEELYLRTRAKMLANAEPVDPRFRQVLDRLTQNYLTILMSNSGQEVAEEYLSAIGLKDAFTVSKFSAGKPQDLLVSLDKIDKKILQSPSALLTIGDFYYNDLALLRELGAKSVWMNPFPGVKSMPCDLELRSVPDLRMFLEKLV